MMMMKLLNWWHCFISTSCSTSEQVSQLRHFLAWNIWRLTGNCFLLSSPHCYLYLSSTMLLVGPTTAISEISSSAFFPGLNKKWKVLYSLVICWERILFFLRFNFGAWHYPASIFFSEKNFLWSSENCHKILRLRRCCYFL